MTIAARLNKEIDFQKRFIKYNKSRIMKRARYIMLNELKSWSESLKQSWKESKETVIKSRIELNRLVDKLSNAYCPELLSREAKQERTNKQMMRAYLAGAQMN